jgi:hypothetical protein
VNSMDEGQIDTPYAHQDGAKLSAYD